MTDQEVSVSVESCEPSQRLHGLAAPPCALFSGPIGENFQPLEAESGALGIALFVLPTGENRGRGRAAEHHYHIELSDAL